MKFGSMMTVTSFFIVDQIMRITDRWNTEMGTDVFWQHWYFPYLKFKPFFYNYTMFDTTAYQNILGETINGQT
jgi:hypothetical protein